MTDFRRLLISVSELAKSRVRSSDDATRKLAMIVLALFEGEDDAVDAMDVVAEIMRSGPTNS